MSANKRPKRVPFKQKGMATLIGLLFTLAASAVLIPYAAREINLKLMQEKAEAEADQLAQLAGGMRGFIAAIQNNPTLLPSGEKQGIDWLKPSTCGGESGNPTEGYIPCTLSGGTFGTLYKTKFTRNSTTNAIEARTSFIVPEMGLNRSEKNKIASRIARLVSAKNPNSQSSSFVAVFSNSPVDAVAQVNPKNELVADYGRIEMIINNAPSNDIYLRTDGTNKMMADLNMNSQSIRNAKDVEVAGTVRAKDLRATGSAQIDGGLYVGGGLESDSLRVNGGTSMKNLFIEDGGDGWMDSTKTFLSAGIYYSTVLTGQTSYTVGKPKCPANSAPRIYAAIQDTGQALNAISRAAVIVTDAGSSWSIQPSAKDVRYELRLDGNNLHLDTKLTTEAVRAQQMKILVQAKCS